MMQSSNCTYDTTECVWTNLPNLI
uniref:Uncharacterized protein n=1 Tax=Arundo donax TaxID=35708 RepID=A0A0A9BUI4_ARUDO